MYALPYILFSRLHQAAIAARRRDRTSHYLLWSACAGVLAALMLVVGATLLMLVWRVGLWPLAIVVFAIMIAPVVASTLTRHVFVPLGWKRFAFYGGLAARPGTDGEAYALCCAAWAFSRKPDAKGEKWLVAHRDLRLPLGDAEVVVTGLIAAGRGDDATARTLLRSSAMLVESHPPVRELVGEWLAVDAVERGAWAELQDDALASRWPATPLTYFLEGVAARHVEAEKQPSAMEMQARWLLAPHRRKTRVLLTMSPTGHVARSTAPEPDSVDVIEPFAVETAPLPRAVAAHLALDLHAPTLAALATTVRAWDAALSDGATHAWLARRALELDAPLGAVDRALRELTQAVTDQLARMADAAQLGAPTSSGPVGDALSRRLRHGRLDALETGFSRWAQRRYDGAVRAAIDEWREFVALHAAYSAAVRAGGIELRRLAFPHAFSTGSNMAAWLWNARNEYVLSHAISRWLLSEALVVGDAEAIELGHRNCSLSVPTRLGNVEESSPLDRQPSE
ncbi:MAG: hypothetical protein M4D80_28675 [Myxococcota bacterium]|nr:hypothetical protein [Myxococcota bacterium]